MTNSNKLTRRQFGILAGAAAISSTLSFHTMAKESSNFVIASNTEVDNLDPHTATGNIPLAFFINVYDSLVRVNGNPPEIEPSLARSWDVSNDGMVYTFSLQPGAVFHDGSPVDAAAVKLSFDRLIRIGAGVSWMFDGILDEKSVKAIDDVTVEMTLRRPFAPFLQVLPWVFVINPTVLAANSGDDDGQSYFQANVAGSGPFEISRFEAGTLYGFSRFAKFWDTDGGNVDNVVWRIVRETATQRLLVERGEVHFVLDLTAEDMQQLSDDTGVVKLIEPTLQPFYLRMNSAHGPLKDLNLRKAVSYAFDYSAMIDVLEYADVLHGPFPSGLPGHNDDMEVYTTDMDKAREYLAKSDSPDGDITLTYVYVSGYDQQRRIGLILLDQLSKLNIRLEIKALTWPDMVAAAQSPETQGDFMAVWESANYADLDNFAFPAFHSSQNGSWSNPVFSDPRVDKLIERGRTEIDPQVRVDIYKEMQKIIVDQASDIYCATLQRLIAYRDNVEGFTYTPIGTNAPWFYTLSIT